MPLLSHLGLVIRRHKLDALRIIMKDEPKRLSSSDITNLFNDSLHCHSLLLVRGRIGMAHLDWPALFHRLLENRRCHEALN